MGGRKADWMRMTSAVASLADGWEAMADKLRSSLQTGYRGMKGNTVFAGVEKTWV